MNPKSPPSPAFDFKKLVDEHADQLTKSEIRISRYILKNQDEVAFTSVAELASHLEVSEATVVRFAQTLGFSGFPDMRTALQASFRTRVTHSSRLRGRLDELREGGDIFEQLTVREMDYLAHALETVSRQALADAVELMRTRSRIYLLGQGPSVSLVSLLEVRLRRFGRPVTALTVTGREMLETLFQMTKDDLLFAICFFDVNPALQMALDYAQEVGCPSILLTDTLESILPDKAQVILSARRGPVSEFHSLVVPMNIINTLLLMLARQDQPNVMSSLDRLDALRERYADLNSKPNS